GRGTSGPHQLPAADGDLHDDLLRPRPRPLRPRGPGRPARDRAGGLGVPVAGVLRMARLLRPGANGMGVALVYLRTTAQLPALVAGEGVGSAEEQQPHRRYLLLPRHRAPLSYELDTSQFIRAVKTPSIQGWRVAWTPDLDGLIPVGRGGSPRCP